MAAVFRPAANLWIKLGMLLLAGMVLGGMVLGGMVLGGMMLGGVGWWWVWRAPRMFDGPMPAA